MSSSQRKNLTVGVTTAKGAGATVTGDTLVLPPDCDDLMLAITADSSIAGAVDATLEVSVDGVNWTPAKTATGAAGGGVVARISVDNVDNQIDLNVVTTPALNAAQYTDVCRVSFAGATEAVDAEYSLTLSGTDAASYRLNNVTSGDVSAPVTAQFEDNVVLETASTFALTASGYDHDVTITVSEDSGLTTDTSALNIKRTVPATMANGSLSAMAGDAADGVDTCTLTPGGGPSSPVAATYSLAITGTDAAYYRIHNTTTGAKSDDGAPLKTLSGIASGNSVVLEADQLFNFSEATTHSVTVTNTESINGETAAVSVSITVNALSTFDNTSYADFPSNSNSESRIDMGVKADFSEDEAGFGFATSGDHTYVNMGIKADFDNGGDAFWFRRRSDAWTVSWWMSNDTWENGSDYTTTKFIFSTENYYYTGIEIYQREGTLRFYYWKNVTNYGKWVSPDATSWADGNFHHYMITYDGPGAVAAGEASAGPFLKVYRDGVAITMTYTDAGTWLDNETNETNNTGSHFRLGKQDFSNASNTNAVMDVKEVAIWKTDLSAANAATLYNSGVAGYNAALIEASNLKRYYKAAIPLSTTDTAGNFTAVLGSAVTQVEDNFWFRRRSDKFTISFWIKMASSSANYSSSGGTSYSTICGAGGTAGGQLYWQLTFYLTEFRLMFRYSSSNYGIFKTGDVRSWQDGNWHHIAVTWDGPGATVAGQASSLPFAKIYHNGTAETTSLTSSGTWLGIDLEDTWTTRHLRWGDTDQNVYNEVASYDEIAIWKTDLSAANITTLYNSGTPTDIIAGGIEASSLKRYYRFENKCIQGLSTAYAGAGFGTAGDNGSYQEKDNGGMFPSLETGGNFRTQQGVTYSLWFKVVSGASTNLFNALLQEQGVYNSKHQGTFIMMKMNNYIGIFDTRNGNTQYTYFNTGALAANKWYHLTFVTHTTAGTGTGCVSYINGILPTGGGGGTTRADAVPSGTVEATSLLAQVSYTAGFLTMDTDVILAVDEITTWSAQLSAAEVLELYTTLDPTTHSQAANLERYITCGDHADDTEAAIRDSQNPTFVLDKRGASTYSTSDAQGIDSKGNYKAYIGSEVTTEDY